MSTQIHYVIHHSNPTLSIQQANVAFECGADGVFLIGGIGKTLLQCAKKIKQAHPDKSVGVNLLSHGICEDFLATVLAGLDAIWFDWSDVTSRGAGKDALVMSGLMQKLKRPFSVFAGVAFKYQAHEPNPSLAAANAIGCGFIPCTSGTGTGKPPTVAKLQKMAAASGGLLAVASGITPENVEPYLPHLAHILVATGVNVDEYHADPERLTRLCELAHEAVT